MANNRHKLFNFISSSNHRRRGGAHLTFGHNMKVIRHIAVFIWCMPWMAIARTPPTKTDYSSLKIEELAMRFRYPDRYMNLDRGEPAPRDMALGEILRRKKLQQSTAKDEVVFLLGKPDEGFEMKLRGTAVEWSYDMNGGTLIITFDAKGFVSQVLEHHDGDPQSAHTDDLLRSTPHRRKTEQSTAPNRQ